MDTLIPIFKALSDKNRLRILAALNRHDELCACQLTELIQVTGATASRHMGVLLSAGLVCSRKDGRWVYYRICKECPDMHPFIDWFQEQLSIKAEIQADVITMEAILAQSPEDLCRKQRGQDSCC